jgi:hypothetical protein
MRYERSVYDALHRVLGETGAIEIDGPARHSGVDYLVRLSPHVKVGVKAPHVKVGVEAKFARQLLTRERILAAQNYALTTGTPVLIVTNAPLSGAVHEMNRQASNRQLGNGPRRSKQSRGVVLPMTTRCIARSCAFAEGA